MICYNIKQDTKQQLLMNEAQYKIIADAIHTVATTKHSETFVLFTPSIFEVVFLFGSTIKVSVDVEKQYCTVYVMNKCVLSIVLSNDVAWSFGSNFKDERSNNNYERIYVLTYGSQHQIISEKELIEQGLGDHNHLEKQQLETDLQKLLRKFGMTC